MKTYTVDELLRLQAPQWLVNGAIPLNGLIALCGPPGSGKTFVALDIALSVAAGVPWQGHPTRRGYVVYISAEGGGGLSKRVGAWLDTQALTSEEQQELLVRFVTATISVNPSSEDIQEILLQPGLDPVTTEVCAPGWFYDEDHEVVEEAPLPLFVVVDTLARCFDGNENQQEDMGRFIQGLDVLRAEGATVLVVHHTNKRELEERGSNVFRGACDTMMFSRTDKDTPGAFTLTCDKQKDYEPFVPMKFALQTVPRWNSCVVVKPSKFVEKVDLLVLLLQRNGPQSYTDLLTLSGWGESSLDRYLQAGEDQHRIIKEKGKNGKWRSRTPEE